MNVSQLLSNRTVLFPPLHQLHSTQVKFTDSVTALIPSTILIVECTGKVYCVGTTVYVVKGVSNLTNTA